MTEEAKQDGGQTDKSTLLCCPFCGEDPELETEGTWIEINCCVSMSRQKSDYLSIEERDSWNSDIHRFGLYEEFKVLCAVTSEWNTRST